MTLTKPQRRLLRHIFEGLDGQRMAYDLEIGTRRDSLRRLHDADLIAEVTGTTKSSDGTETPYLFGFKVTPAGRELAETLPATRDLAYWYGLQPDRPRSTN